MGAMGLFLARFMPPRWLQQRIQLDQLYNQGRAVGLTREQVDEVIGTWNRYYQQTPWPFDFETVGKALTARAFGEDWAPPMGRGTQ